MVLERGLQERDGVGTRVTGTGWCWDEGYMELIDASLA